MSYTYKRKEIINNETIIDKELLDHLQDAFERIFAISNVHTYTSFEQIGVTVGGETILSIMSKLEDNSEILTYVDSKNNTSIYPYPEGNLQIYCTRKGYGKARFWKVVDGIARIWKGVVDNNVWLGWYEDYNTKTKPTPEDIGAAPSSQHNYKTFTSLEQVGLSFDSLTSGNLNIDMTTIFDVLPEYSSLEFYVSTSNTFKIAMVNRINSNCGTTFKSEAGYTYTVKFEKHGTARGVVTVMANSHSAILTAMYSRGNIVGTVDTFTIIYNRGKAFITSEEANNTFLKKDDDIGMSQTSFGIYLENYLANTVKTYKGDGVGKRTITFDSSVKGSAVVINSTTCTAFISEYGGFYSTPNSAYGSNAINIPYLDASLVDGVLNFDLTSSLIDVLNKSGVTYTIRMLL